MSLKLRDLELTDYEKGKCGYPEYSVPTAVPGKYSSHCPQNAGYINLLQQLTAAGTISQEAYAGADCALALPQGLVNRRSSGLLNAFSCPAERFKQLHDSPDYRIVVVEGTSY